MLEQVFEHRGVGFRRTATGFWVFDALPRDGQHWERYMTDQEVADLGEGSMRAAVDRMLAGETTYNGDIKERKV